MFKTLKMIVKLNWRASKRLVIASCISSLVSVVQVYLNVFIPKLIIEAFMAENRDTIPLYIAMIVISNAVLMKIPGYTNSIIKSGTFDLLNKYNYYLDEKTMSLSLAQLEKEETKTLADRARFIMLSQSPPQIILNTGLRLLNSLLLIIAVVTAVFDLTGALLLILPLTVVLQAITAFFGMSKMQKSFSEFEGNNRLLSAYIMPAYDNNRNMDIRLFKMGDYFIKKVVGAVELVTNDMQKPFRVMGSTTGLLAALNSLAVAAAYLYLGVRSLSSVWGPQLNLAQFAFYLSAFTLLNSRLGDLIISAGELITILMMSQPLGEFLSLEPEDESVENPEPMPDIIESIEARDLHFTYPGSDEEVLKGVSFKIEGGEKISLAGRNGSGKTTLVKLLCRFYDPDSGEILINGIDIRRFDPAEYRKRMSVIFQDYHILHLSLAENVACSTDYSDEKVLKQLERAGFNKEIAASDAATNLISGRAAENLPEDPSAYDRAFDNAAGLRLESIMSGKGGKGVKLSGGESQKVAIARALYRDSNFIILDEPTSALDPQSEAEIYEQFNSLVEDKTAIYISHRMSSSVFCDRIFIIQDGVISEEGTHEELMAAKGLYYKLFSVQEKNYDLDLQ